VVPGAEAAGPAAQVENLCHEWRRLRRSGFGSKSPETPNLGRRQAPALPEFNWWWGGRRVEGEGEVDGEDEGAESWTPVRTSS